MINYDRKPVYWYEVIQRVGRSEIAPDVPTLTPEQVYNGTRLPKTCLSFSKKVPQHFILDAGYNSFLINTEGFNYPRYVALVVS